MTLCYTSTDLLLHLALLLILLPFAEFYQFPFEGLANLNLSERLLH